MRESKGAKVRYKAPMMYLPSSWKDVTWADANWMAQHIASIDEAMIREAVAASLWPDFVQEVTVYRLLVRQEQIRHSLGVGTAREKPIPAPPTIRIPLSTTDEIVAAERRYGLPRGSLAAELEGDVLANAYAPEIVVRNGRIADGRCSPLVRALVRHRYPSGLVVRYKRKKDRHPPEIRQQLRK